jgi:hypothetical protein
MELSCTVGGSTDQCHTPPAHAGLSPLSVGGKLGTTDYGGLDHGSWTDYP